MASGQATTLSAPSPYPVHCLLKLETTACDSCLGWSQLENLQEPDLFLGSLPWRAATTTPSRSGYQLMKDVLSLQTQLLCPREDRQEALLLTDEGWDTGLSCLSLGH